MVCFNSHWTYEKFRDHFNIPTNRCVVIKNGIDEIEQAKPYLKGQPIKIIHQNTPWRGLSVLLGAMQLVKNPLVTLDVYSSTEVYGNNSMIKTIMSTKNFTNKQKNYLMLIILVTDLILHKR